MTPAATLSFSFYYPFHPAEEVTEVPSGPVTCLMSLQAEFLIAEAMYKHPDPRARHRVCRQVSRMWGDPHAAVLPWDPHTEEKVNTRARASAQSPPTSVTSQGLTCFSVSTYLPQARARPRRARGSFPSSFALQASGRGDLTPGLRPPG